MTAEEIIAKIEAANLIGRGGAGYPTGRKWRDMYNKKHPEMYICVNGSEGEPGTLKDGYILKNHRGKLIDGLKIAYKVFPRTKKIFVYLRKDYFEKYRELLEKETAGLPAVVFREPGGYLCGENTVLINSIEGKRFEPRRKPPYCSEVGLWGKPTLVNNLETFFRIAQIVDGEYRKTRFYSLTGAVKNKGVTDMPVSATLQEVLRQTGNDLTDSQFLQLGGGASGLYFTRQELDKTPADRGTGAIIVYDSSIISVNDLVRKKTEFLLRENCGKCTPCREGVYRLNEMAKNNSIDENRFRDFATVMADTSFCGLGEGAGLMFLSLLEKKDKIWPNKTR